jgi:vacuolar-type H+-ATPase subunit E/Vma4
VTATAPRDPLLPVRQALLARAASEAERLLAEADADAGAILIRARREADAIRAEARAEGEADAAQLLAAERARGRRRARAVVLGAERESYDELRSRIARALPSLRTDPAYRDWVDSLGAQVRALLGADATVTEHPDGGVSGEVTGRRVAYTLAGLADRALEALGPDVETMWAG